MRPDIKRVRKNRSVGYTYIKCALCGRLISLGGTIPVRKDGRIIEICKIPSRCGEQNENKKLREVK